MIVVDASVIVAALGSDDVDGDLARQRLAGERLAAPALLDLEVLSVLRRATRRGLVDERRARMVLADLSVMPLRRASHLPLMQRIWALRENVSAYDAAYVALAEALSTTLLTADARLGRASGVRCEVEVLG